MMVQRPGWNYWNASDLIKKGKLDIGDGYRAKNSEMGDDGLPFARAGNINNGFHFDDADILSIESVEKAKAAGKLSKPGDVTFTSKGTFGRFAYVNERTRQFVYSPQLCYWRIRDHRLINRRFLYYWMQGADCMNQLVQIKGLTDMADYVSLTNQRKMWISAPPLLTQRKIAAILSAYDDLIENNLRRIKILEEMAQNLYREWFVKFRFPGHQHARFTDSPLGRIPEGWRWVKLKDVCDSINYGFTASANKKLVGPKFLRITDIVPSVIEWESVPYCEVEPDDVEKYALSEGDIVIARTGATTGYAKRLNKRHPKSIFASYLVRIRPNPLIGKHYAGIIVESNKYKEFIKQNLGGSAQPQANAQVLTSIDILVPTADMIQAFDKFMEPLVDKKELLQITNQTLRHTRDLLLSRLISGEVDVSELDITIPKEAAI